MLHGVDLSTYQTQVNYMALGVLDFAYVKAFDAGASPQVDPMLLLHCAGLVDYAVPYGCYCFGHPSHDVAESVDGYLGAVKGLAPKLLHVIDMESLSRLPDGTQVIPGNAGPWALSWCDRVQSLASRPAVYASTSYWVAMLRQAPALGAFKLWRAQYSSMCPLVMPPGPAAIALQWTGTGRVDGVQGDADLDVVYADDLSALLL